LLGCGVYHATTPAEERTPGGYAANIGVGAATGPIGGGAGIVIKNVGLTGGRALAANLGTSSVLGAGAPAASAALQGNPVDPLSVGIGAGLGPLGYGAGRLFIAPAVTGPRVQALMGAPGIRRLVGELPGGLISPLTPEEAVQSVLGSVLNGGIAVGADALRDALGLGPPPPPRPGAPPNK